MPDWSDGEGRGVAVQARGFVVVISVLLGAALGVTGCTSGGGKHPSSSPTSSRVATSGASTPATGASTTSSSNPALLGGGSTDHLTGFCARLVATGLKLNVAQTSLYDGGSASALTTIITELTELENGAPADIRAALEDMRSAFQSAQQVLAHNNVTERGAELAKVGPRLEKDDKLISDYSASKCAAS
jgi:hypothetical protein